MHTIWYIDDFLYIKHAPNHNYIIGDKPKYFQEIVDEISSQNEYGMNIECGIDLLII